MEIYYKVYIKDNNLNIKGNLYNKKKHTHTYTETHIYLHVQLPDRKAPLPPRSMQHL